jgi:prepilin-type N-terminal cleavage/methylation domain-containing protein
MKIKKFIKGFTLAEVLITLGIIGIVASMTIPTLMNNAQENQYHAAMKKAYTIISQATMSIVNENGGSLWDNSSADSTVLSKNMSDEYKKYLSYITQDTMNNIVKSIWYGYKSQTNVMDETADNTRYGLILKDGVILRFWSDQNCATTAVPSSMHWCGDIIIDINGSKKPNMFGKDIYEIDILKDTAGNYKVLPGGKAVGYSCVAGSTTAETSFGCAEKVIMGESLE